MRWAKTLLNQIYFTVFLKFGFYPRVQKCLYTDNYAYEVISRTLFLGTAEQVYT